MNTIQGISNSAPLSLSKPDSNSVSKAEKSFSDYLNSTLDQVINADKKSESAIEKLNTGEAENMHQVMLAVSEADISMRMLIQVRNKALDAYDNIMQMQI
jgi:flagellar hook-basal body complex protein FliE